MAAVNKRKSCFPGTGKLYIPQDHKHNISWWINRKVRCISIKNLQGGQNHLQRGYCTPVPPPLVTRPLRSQNPWVSLSSHYSTESKRHIIYSLQTIIRKGLLPGSKTRSRIRLECNGNHKITEAVFRSRSTKFLFLPMGNDWKSSEKIRRFSGQEYCF
jgi:hypothetical protein